MTCADARQRILTADLAALRGESDPALRAHLDGCVVCTADAARVVTETRRLGVAIVAREWQPRIQRANRRRAALILAPIGVAAALTLIAVRTHQFVPLSRTSPPRAAGPRVEKAMVSDGDTDLVSSARINASGPRRVATKSTARRTGQRPEPVVTARQATSDWFVERPTPEVSVTVGENQRAAIISTSNPKVTVVWFTRGQQP
jgi:AcrR family transcriptional regulator